MVARTQDAGLARMTTALAALPYFLQWGTGSAAIKSANVLTTATTTEARVAAVATQVLGTVANDTLQLVGALTAAGDRAITEVGAFDAAGAGSPPVGGNMDLYTDFGVVTLKAGDSISFTIKCTYS